MDTFKVEAHVDQWAVLRELLNIVVKAEGLNVATAVAFWDQKIKEGAADAEAEEAKRQEDMKPIASHPTRTSLAVVPNAKEEETE